MGRFLDLLLLGPLALTASAAVLAAGCGGAEPACPGYEARALGFEPAATGLAVGGSRVVRLAVEPVPSCDLPVRLRLEGDPVLAAPAPVVIPEGERVVEVELEALEATGNTRVVAREGGAAGLEAVLEARVVEPALACDGAARGEIGPGEALDVTTGQLEGARVAFPSDPEMPSLELSIGCGEDIVEGPLVPLGPAVRIEPVAGRFFRELTVRIPVEQALLPARAGRGHVEVVYRGPDSEAPRTVSFPDRILRGGPTGGYLELRSSRLGTFQAAVHPEAGSRQRTRRYVFRGLLGVSMGGGGAASIGLRNPREFDFVAPLGGPSSWTHMLESMRRYHFGGFCPVDPSDPSTLTDRHCEVAPARDVFELTQSFESWFYPDGWDGQGGTFSRENRCQMLRDLTLALGNPGYWDGPEQRFFPPGVAERFEGLTDRERCEQPVVLEGYYDATFNPDGSFPVVTFCDGPEVRDDEGRIDRGVWDPDGTPHYPLDIVLAVDLNRNGRRDAGEPIVVGAAEPWDDVGLDGLPSEREPGYDPTTNPDPSGDDWHYLFNPTGTEGNGIYDEGEPFLDYGLDGVPGTPQREDGGFDHGEGNGVFDENPTAVTSFHARDGYRLLLEMAEADLDSIDIWADGGLRDIFSFASITNGLVSALAARGRDVRYYNGFTPLSDAPSEGLFFAEDVDYRAIGRDVMIRYGDPDASEEQCEAGDGGHVGTVFQITNRLLTACFAMSARWPGGDRTRVAWNMSGSSFLDHFTDSTGRVSPYAVVLPPGYHDEAHREQTYPVIYFLHGYGMRPEDLVAMGLLFPSFMVDVALPEHLRMQKVIMVFPDGRCRSDPDPESESHGTDGCLRGTFYVDSWRADGPQMETALLELMAHIDATYRTRAPEDVTELY